jgi:hypothetical protein
MLTAYLCYKNSKLIRVLNRISLVKILTFVSSRMEFNVIHLCLVLHEVAFRSGLML